MTGRQWIARAGRWLRVLFDRRRVEAEIAEELRFHVDMETADRIRAGVPPERARAEALGDFGGPDAFARYQREGLDVQGTRMLDAAGADVRLALRGLRRSPGFAMAAVLTLALGVGSTAAVYGAVQAVLLAPLPYPAPERLVRVFQQNAPDNRWTISNADWQALRHESRSFSGVALARGGGASFTVGDRAEWTRVGRVTAGFFRTLGVTLAGGPGFRDGDDAPGAAPTVVVSDAFWRRHFGDGDPVGRTLTLDRVPHTVVGVLAGGEQRHAGLRAEVWPILQLEPPVRRGPFGFVGIGRLRDGVSVEAARRELDALSVALHPRWAASFRDRTARLTPYPLHEVLVGDAARSLTVLALGVGLVLLIAVANVANLVLVRAVTRQREMALRAALGAGRRRLARLLLTESLVLGALGGAVGLVVAGLGITALQAAGPALPRLDEARLDLRVAVLTLAVAVGSGLLAGLYPLAVGTSRGLASSLRRGDRRTGASRGTRRLQDALVAGEFALALPLLVGAGLLLQSFVRLQRVDPGFDAARLLTAELTLPEIGYEAPEARDRFWAAVLRQVQAVPGVVAAGLTTSLPPDNGGDTNNFDLLDRPVPAGGAEPVSPWAWVTPDLFAALDVPLLDGRALREADSSTAAPVVLVSRAWARRYYPGERVVGKRLYAGGCRECPPTTVVGVVGDVKYAGLAASADGVYAPTLGTGNRSLGLIVRTRVPPGALAGAVRAAVRAVDPGVPVRELAPMTVRLEAGLANPARITGLVGAFAVTAVTLAALGVFGVMSYAVAQQRRELGVRLALGAPPAAVIGLVLRRGTGRAVVGLGVGLCVTLIGAPRLGTLLYGVRPADPGTLALSTALLLGVAGLACWLPGRRAARIAPVEAMAAE